MRENNESKKFDFVEDLLIDLFDINEEFLNRNNSEENVRINLNIDDLASYLSVRWNALFENAQKIEDIRKAFLDDYLPWKEGIESFKKAKKEEKISEFLEKYFSVWQQLSFEYNKLKIEEVEGFLYQEQPSPVQYYHEFDGQFGNLLLHDSDLLHLTIHLNLVKNPTGTFTLLTIFSFWLDFQSINYSPNLDYITEKYQFEILAIKLFNRLMALGYIRIPSIIQKEDNQNFSYYPSDYSVSTNIFQPTYCCAAKFLNDNPRMIFNELTDHLTQIEDLKLSILEEKEFSPNDWYKTLPNKLKNFIIQGKELLYQVEDFLTFQEEVLEPTEKISIKEKKEDTGQLIIGFFKDIYEKDKKNKSIKEEDRGFRTINEIYETYDNLIDISRPTFYKHFKNLYITKFLEKRKNPGIGGGVQYRYRALEIRSLAPIKEPKLKKTFDEQDFRKEKVKIQEALINFNEKEYQSVINIIEKILENPSDGLIKENNLFISCLFYLGCSYYKNKQFKKSFQYFDKIIIINNNLVDLKYYIIMCKFKNRDYENCLNDCITLIKNVEENISLSEVNLDYSFVSVNFFRNYDLVGKNKDRIVENDLSDLFIPLKTKNNPINLDLGYSEEIKHPRYFIRKFKKTILSLRNLYKILIKLCYLRVELVRRMIFRNVIEGNQIEIIKQIDDLIKFNKKVEENFHFFENRYLVFRPYFAYLRDLFEILNMKELADKIKLEYPSLREFESLYAPWLPKSIQKQIKYIDHINSYFRSVNQDGNLYHYTKRKFIDNKLEVDIYKEKVLIEKDEIDLIGEDFIIQAILIEKFSLNKFIEDFTDFNKNLSNKVEDFDKLLRKIEKLYTPYYRDDKPKVYLNLIKNAITYCKSQRLNKLLNYLKIVNERIGENFKRFYNLEVHFKKNLIDQISQYWIERDKNSQYLQNLKLDYNPEKSHLKWMVTDSILKDISELIKKNPRNYGFIIKLFDKKIADEVIAIIKEFNHSFNYYKLHQFRISHRLHYEKDEEQGIIGLETELFLDMTNLKGMFDEKLDYLYYGILGILRYGITEFNIYVNDENMKKFLDYFSNKFQNEYKNTCVEFEVENNPNENSFKLKLYNKNN